MPSEMDAYRASDEDMSARSRRRHAAPWRKRLLSVFSVLFLVGVVVAVALVLRKANDKPEDAASESSSSPNAATDAAVTDKPAANDTTSTSGDDAVGSECVTRRPAAHTRTVAFWQSEVDGCEKVPLGVTHVVFGFALVDGATGRVVPTFQNTDAEIRSCVQTLRKNCIASLGSIGGATNHDALANVTDAGSFAASAVALVSKFGFDGIDIDDETVGDAYNASRSVAVVEATRAALSAADKTLLLTYDAYFYEGDPVYCVSEDHKSYSRCFPTALLASVDWINIMAYNVARENATAAAVYERALNTTFADWRTQLGGDFSKATIGVCLHRSCAFGPGPSTAVIASWNSFARTAGTGGGMMIYAASSEVAEDFAVTRSVLPVAP